MQKGKIYLIPSFLGESQANHVFPDFNREVILATNHFLVENLRTARRFLKAVESSINIDELHFEILDKNTDEQIFSKYLTPVENGENIGIISEAGCPGIADPGANLVALAHQKSIEVVPLIGPSSILLAQMASGMNGQSFAFNGYLPIKGNATANALQQLERRSAQEKQSQIFIEAPYRNMQIMELMLKTLSPSTLLCIAADITGPQQFIKTKSVKAWKGQLPSIHKVPAIFIIMA
ncbi:MAG: SAM-dependent methyltransferase [Bacteroidales bacterium]|nr:SAM-dependent methyltransferase [Bacteroidales bacterium]